MHLGYRMDIEQKPHRTCGQDRNVRLGAGNFQGPGMALDEAPCLLRMDQVRQKAKARLRRFRDCSGPPARRVREKARKTRCAGATALARAGCARATTWWPTCCAGATKRGSYYNNKRTTKRERRKTRGGRKAPLGSANPHSRPEFNNFLPLSLFRWRGKARQWPRQRQRPGQGQHQTEERRTYGRPEAQAHRT